MPSVVLAVLGVLAFSYMTIDAASPVIGTASVTRGSVGQTVAASGTVEAVTTVQVGTQVSGRVITVPPCEYPAWVWTLAGAATVFGAAIYGWYAPGSMPDVASSRIGPGRPALMPTAGSGAVILALGLLLYIVGLLAPLRSDKA